MTYEGDITPGMEFAWQSPGSAVKVAVKVIGVKSEAGEPAKIFYTRGGFAEATWEADAAQFRANVTLAEAKTA